MLAKPFDVAVIGNNTRDVMFYDSSGEFLRPRKKNGGVTELCFEYGSKIPIDRTWFTFGGGGANAAVNFAHQGWKTTLITAVGDDDAGQSVIDHLHERRVDTGWLEIHEGKMTGFSFILTAGRAREHVIFLYRGANEALQGAASRLAKIKPRWWYIAQLSPPVWRKTLDVIFARPGKKAWNPGSKQLAAGKKALAPYLAQTTVLGLNYAEAAELVGKRGSVVMLAKALRAMGPQIVIITQGTAGADADDGQKVYHQAAVEVKGVADTTGVGDAFHSTFVAVYDRTKNITRALAAAAKNSAAVTTKIGAQEGLKKMI